MKLLSPLLFIFCLALTSCNHHPKEDTQSVVSSTDSTISEKAYVLPDSVMLTEPIIKTLRHYFSDTTNMDSFVVEMPAGNMMANWLQIKIYNPANNLIYIDSFSATNMWSAEYFDQAKAPNPEIAANALRQFVMTIFTINNFNYAGEENAIKNAAANDIKNMIAWNEAVSDTDRIIFNYYGNGTRNYVNYSNKLKRGVMSVQTYIEDAD